MPLQKRHIRKKCISAKLMNLQKPCRTIPIQKHTEIYKSQEPMFHVKH